MPPEISTPTNSLADAAGTTSGQPGADQQTADAIAAAGRWLDDERPDKDNRRKGGHKQSRSEAAPEPKRRGRVHLEEEATADSIERKMAAKRGTVLEVDDEDEEDEDPAPRSRDKREARPTKPSRVSDDADDDLDDEDELEEADEADDEDDDTQEDDSEDDDADDIEDFAKRFGIKNPARARQAQSAVIDDIRATLQGGQQQQRPRDDGSATQTAPQNSGSDGDLINDELLKEIEDWSPAAAKAVKGLTAQVKAISQKFQEGQQRAAATVVNRIFDGLAKAGYEKTYGKGRSVTAKQRAVRDVVTQTAIAYQQIKAAAGQHIDDEDAVHAAHLLVNKDKALKDAKRQGRGEVERAVRRRHRNVDIVPGAGSTSRGKGDVEDDSERGALRIAGQWIDKRVSRRVA